MLVGTMLTYLALASRIVSSDKLATVSDVNALLASTVSDEVGSTLGVLSDKLKYFAAEGAPNEARARALFDADDDVLSLELWKKSTSGGYEKGFGFTDALISNWIAPSISLPLGAMCSSVPAPARPRPIC